MTELPTSSSEITAESFPKVLDELFLVLNALIIFAYANKSQTTQKLLSSMQDGVSIIARGERIEQ